MAYTHAIKTLDGSKYNFESCFSDLDIIANDIRIFQNPFNVDIGTLTPEGQLKIVYLQCNNILKDKYERSSLLELDKSPPKFDQLHKFTLFSTFGTNILISVEKQPRKLNKLEKYTYKN